MHGAKHARDEFVNSITFSNEWYERSHSTLVVGASSERRKDQFLKGLDLVLEVHEIGDSLVTLIRVVDAFQADVLFVLECSVELRVVAVEGKFVDQEKDVFLDQSTVTS